MTSPVRAPRPTPRRAPVPAPAPRRSHLRVVPPPAKPKVLPSVRRRRTGAILAVAMVVVFGSLLASAMFHGMLVGGQSDLDRIDAQIEEERTALAQEKLELANLQSPARITAEAAKLGMVPSDQQHWVTPGSTDDPIVTGTADDATDATDEADDTTDPTDPTSSTGSAQELASGDGGGSAQ